MIEVKCDGCGKQYGVPEQYAGKKMRCKKCSAIIAIPAAEPAPPVEEAAVSEPEPEPEPEPQQQLAREPVQEPAEGAVEQPAEAPPARRRPGAKKFPSGKGIGKGAGAKRSFPARGAKAAKGAKGSKGFKGVKARARKGPGSGKFQGKKTSRLGSRRAGSRKPAPEGPESADGVESEASSKKKRLLLIGGCAAAALVVAAAVYFLFFTGESPADKGGKEPEKVAQAVPGSSEKGSEAREAGMTEAGAVGGAAGAQEPGEPAAPAGPVDALSVIPKDINSLAHIAFGRLVNVPTFGQKVREFRGQEEIARLLEEAGFDPMAHLGGIWVAANVPTGEVEPDQAPVLVILEGTFDKKQCLATLQSESMIANRPASVNGKDVYQVQSEDFQGFLTFLADDKLLVGTEALFNEAIKLLAGGETVRANDVLKDLSGDFRSPKLAWVAFELPKGVQDALAARGKELEGQMPPIPVVNGGLLAMEPTDDGEGVNLELGLRCATAEDVTKAQQWASGLVGMGRMMLPEPLKPLLAGVKIQPPEENVLRVTLSISGEMLKKLENAPGLLLSPEGAAAEGGEGEAEFEEPAEGGEPGAGKGEAAAEEPAEKSTEESTEESTESGETDSSLDELDKLLKEGGDEEL